MCQNERTIAIVIICLIASIPYLFVGFGLTKWIFRGGKNYFSCIKSCSFTGYIPSSEIKHKMCKHLDKIFTDAPKAANTTKVGHVPKAEEVQKVYCVEECKNCSDLEVEKCKKKQECICSKKCLDCKKII
jgi:hypothetical protein